MRFEDKLGASTEYPYDIIDLLVERHRKPLKQLVDSTLGPRHTIEEVVIRETKGSNQSEGLILRGRETVADDDGAADDDGGIKDVGSRPGGGGAWRLRKLNWPHPR